MKCSICENDARWTVTIATIAAEVVVRRGYCADCIHDVAVQGRGAALDLPGDA